MVVGGPKERPVLQPGSGAGFPPLFAGLVEPVQSVASEEVPDQPPHLARGFVAAIHGPGGRPQRFESKTQNLWFDFGKRWFQRSRSRRERICRITWVSCRERKGSIEQRLDHPSRIGRAQLAGSHTQTLRYGL